eukprot:11092497-Karenia_brevis.AAC.1
MLTRHHTLAGTAGNTQKMRTLVTLLTNLSGLPPMMERQNTCRLQILSPGTASCFLEARQAQPTGRQV